MLRIVVEHCEALDSRLHCKTHGGLHGRVAPSFLFFVLFVGILSFANKQIRASDEIDKAFVEERWEIRIAQFLMAGSMDGSKVWLGVRCIYDALLPFGDAIGQSKSRMIQVEMVNFEITKDDRFAHLMDLDVGDLKIDHFYLN